MKPQTPDASPNASPIDERRDGLLAGRSQITARAYYIAERIDARAPERGELLATAPTTVRAGAHGCAMIFRYGVVVLFDLEPIEESSFLEGLRPLLRGALDNPESESAKLVIDTRQEERPDSSGSLHLRRAGLPRLQVVAHVLAKSTALAYHEERVAGAFERIEPLAQALRQERHIRFPVRDLQKQLGEVLLTQARTVGGWEVSEKPEITWDDAELDRLYERLRVEYELAERDRALTRKLDILFRTSETLLGLLDDRRTLRVEWYIVVLIAVEIVLFVYDLFGPG